jgi:hypothetical protein
MLESRLDCALRVEARRTNGKEEEEEGRRISEQRMAKARRPVHSVSAEEARED